MLNTNRRRDATVESSRVGVGGVNWASDKVFVVGVSVSIRYLMDQSVGSQTAAAMSDKSAVARLSVGLDVSVVGRRRLGDDQGDCSAEDGAAGLEEQRVEQRETGTCCVRVADHGHRPESHDQEWNILDERATKHQEPQVSSTAHEDNTSSVVGRSSCVGFDHYLIACCSGTTISATGCAITLEDKMISQKITIFHQFWQSESLMLIVDVVGVVSSTKRSSTAAAPSLIEAKPQLTPSANCMARSTSSQLPTFPMRLNWTILVV